MRSRLPRTSTRPTLKATLMDRTMTTSTRTSLRRSSAWRRTRCRACWTQLASRISRKMLRRRSWLTGRRKRSAPGLRTVPWRMPRRRTGAMSMSQIAGHPNLRLTVEDFPSRSSRRWRVVGTVARKDIGGRIVRTLTNQSPTRPSTRTPLFFWALHRSQAPHGATSWTTWRSLLAVPLCPWRQPGLDREECLWEVDRRTCQEGPEARDFGWVTSSCGWSGWSGETTLLSSDPMLPWHPSGHRQAHRDWRRCPSPFEHRLVGTCQSHHRCWQGRDPIPSLWQKRSNDTAWKWPSFAECSEGCRAFWNSCTSVGRTWPDAWQL